VPPVASRPSEYVSVSSVTLRLCVGSTKTDGAKVYLRSGMCL
jgi:hypothetical protein